MIKTVVQDMGTYTNDVLQCSAKLFDSDSGGPLPRNCIAFETCCKTKNIEKTFCICLCVSDNLCYPICTGTTV